MTSVNDTSTHPVASAHPLYIPRSLCHPFLLGTTPLSSPPPSQHDLSARAMKNSPPDCAAAIEELLRGQDLAAQLGSLVRTGVIPAGAGGLIDGVMSSLSRAIHALEADKPSVEADRSLVEEVMSEGCAGKKRKSSAAAGRGGFRKRKQASQWRTVIAKETIDQYSWRKYGQKQIHSSKFPRSYFRCTHKYDQGCQATKQVQISEEDPSKYLITYMGEHACKNLDLIPNLIMPSKSSSEPSIISFGSNSSNITQDFPLPSSQLFPQRQEGGEEVLSNLNPGTSASSEYIDLSDLYEGSLLEPDQAASDHEDMSFMDELLISFDDHGGLLL